MEKPKLRRTLYIGLGGTGIKVIKEVKKNFLQNSAKELPSMVKFLCIDSNKGDLEGLPSEGKEKLTTFEKLHVAVNDPASVLVAGGSKYDWIPKSNRDSVVDIEGTGAGQVRSNGRFIFEENEDVIADRLSTIYDQINNITAKDDNYELLAAANIDVHLVFSIAGGTGSGMFISVANLLRRQFPSANLMAYAFSPSFFSSVGVNWNITHNSYGALLELDYYMHGGKGKYTNVARGITNKLFDGVMYIDKNTYTKNHSEEPYCYDFDEVKVIVGHALYLSAGEIGSNAKSIVDNLRTAMSSGGFDKECPNNGLKAAWVSAIGTSEIICNAKADVEFKKIESAIHILEDLINGEQKRITISETNRWIVSLNLDESLGDKDGNYLIDRVLSPDNFRVLKSQSKIKVSENGDYDSTDFEKINNTEIDAKKETSTSIFKEKREIILKKIKEELFPTSGSGTIGISKLIEILSSLKSDALNSKTVLQSEIDDFKSKIDSASDIIKTNIADIKSEMDKWKINRSSDTIEDCKDSIRKQVSEQYKFNIEIDRRETANKVYDSLVELIDSYIQPNSGILTKLQKNVSDAIDLLKEKAVHNFSGNKVSSASTSIDLTSRADKLESSKVEDHPVKDWTDFYNFIGEASVESMSSKSDWKETSLKYFNSKQTISTNGPIIIRVMDTFTSTEERVHVYRDLINRARPLMEISNFGEKIKPSSFIFVSYPCNISEDPVETANKINQFKQEFELALGSDKFDIIPQKDNNKILVYHQIGVIPPFYIQDISYKKNNRTYPNSCEKLYLDYVDTAGSRRKVKPFTDTYFERAYENDGHSLDSEYTGPSKSRIDLWVDCFILGIVKREDDQYSIVHELGEYDPMDDEERNWVNLGKGREVAYQSFIERMKSSEFYDYLDKELSELQQSNQELYDSFFNGAYTEKDRNKLYKEQYSLVNLSSKEDAVPSTIEMIKQEIISIRTRTN